MCPCSSSWISSKRSTAWSGPNWDAGALLEYLVLKLPFAIGQVLPAAVLLGVMLTFGLMSRSHETMAIRTSGLNILSLVRPTLIYSGVVALLLLTLNLYLIPWSQGRLDLFWQTQVDKKPPRNLHNHGTLLVQGRPGHL